MIALLIAASLAAEAQHVIAENTPNPSAVQFQGVKEGNGVVCGEFNAPNKQGGYDGFDYFVYESKDHWMMGSVDGKVMAGGRLYDLTYLWERYKRYGDLNALEEHSRGTDGRVGMIRRCPKD